MYKSLILVISFVFFFASCSFKSPISKKSQITSVECPKTLILAPASKIIDEHFSYSLNKNYSMTCYSHTLDSDKVFFDFTYTIDLFFSEVTNLSPNFNFIVFITDKNENEKIYEESFINNIEIDENNDAKMESYENKYSFSDQLIIDKSIYDKGIKVFIGIFK
jgi:hypothetical protein